MYVITSIGIGIAVGVLHAIGGSRQRDEWSRGFAAAAAIVSAVISTPLNVIFGVVRPVSLGDFIVCGNGRQSCTSVALFTDEFVLDI